MNEPKIRIVCGNCNGPIFEGEPVVTYDVTVADNGDWVISYAHRFSTWCDHFREQNAKFSKDIGVKLDEKSDVD